MMEGKRTQVCTFLLDGKSFGIDVRQVQEILRFQPLTEVPLASREVAGLMNLRGQIVPAIDMRMRMHLQPRQSEEPPTNVVILTESGAVSLLVDEIGDVEEYDPLSIEPVPNNLQVGLREAIQGVYKTDHGLLVMLDAELVVADLKQHLGSTN